jgi:predicted RNA binding protein YcfA (HicA-like mRNA interferase family)
VLEKGDEMKLPRLSGHQVVKALGKAGFQEVRRHGSRVYLAKAGPGEATHLMVHDFKELDPKALMDVIHQAGMNRDEFLSLL